MRARTALITSRGETLFFLICRARVTASIRQSSFGNAILVLHHKRNGRAGRSARILLEWVAFRKRRGKHAVRRRGARLRSDPLGAHAFASLLRREARAPVTPRRRPPDRKSTRLNSSHPSISYAVFCS